MTGPKGWLRPVLAAVGYVLVAGSLCDLTYLLTEWLILLVRPDYEFFEHRVIQALRAVEEPAWGPVVLWLGAGVVAPLAEESFFRGLIQTGLLRWFRRRGMAVTWAAVIFGVVHMDQPHVVPAMIVFGLVVGLQYERAGGVLGPIVTHALFNLKSLTWVRWTQAGL
jgi:membrane protease YdiL (CAAX protease family)